MIGVRVMMFVGGLFCQIRAIISTPRLVSPGGSQSSLVKGYDHTAAPGAGELAGQGPFLTKIPNDLASLVGNQAPGFEAFLAGRHGLGQGPKGVWRLRRVVSLQRFKRLG